MIFPYERRGCRNRMQQTNGRQTENEKAQIKKRCKITRGVKANGVNQGLYIIRVIKSRKMRRAMK
jgi:hypothetical protein